MQSQRVIENFAQYKIEFDFYWNTVSSNKVPYYV